MEFTGELPSRDARAVRCLRAILGGSVEPADREGLAVFCAAVIRNYLMQRWSRRRFGFQDPFDQIADDVARMETALILDPERLMDLGKALRRSLGGIAPSEADDWPVALALRRHLRMRGHQGLEHEWMERHRSEALLLRCLRGALPRIRGIRVVMGARGRLVMSRASDRTLSAIDPEGLVSAVRPCAPHFRPRVVGVALRRVLAPSGIHGGYCFMMDLVRAIHSLRMDLVGFDPAGTGAAPASCTEADRGRAERLASEIREFLLAEAAEIDRRDLAKDRRRTNRGPASVPAEVRSARVAIAVEAVLDEIGFTGASGGRRSLAERLRIGIPEGPRNGDPASHVHRTDYIIKRLRRRLPRLGASFHESLWLRWREGR